MNEYDRKHSRSVAEIQKRMQDIIDRYEADVARLAGTVDFDPDKPFSFADYPSIKARYDKLIKDLESEMQVTVENGVNSEWARADAKNDALAVQVAGSPATASLAGYIARNEEALEAFATRKVNGLNLSGRVWNITDQFDTQIQDAIDIALRDHKTADELSRDVRQYLRHPDKLFRRVRDEHGVLHLSKRAKAYHPGRGVYRSSYMNARRLAATEINMAYRTSDHLRVQGLDFVVGVEVHLSNNHNCKGVPAGHFFDICDELKGKYPKEFKFVGWHPNCRCYATTVLKTKDEMKEDLSMIREGRKPKNGSVNDVDELPENFTKWVYDNGDRIQRAKSLPYFLRDNGKVVDGVWEPYKKVAGEHKPTMAEIAAKRHAERTAEDVKRIKDAWQVRKEAIKAAESLESEYGDIVDFDDARYKDYTGKWAKYMNAVDAYRTSLDNRFSALGLLDDPKAWAKQFTLDDLDKVQAAVEAKLSGWGSMTLEQQKKKLEFEIQWVGDNKKYATWEVAKAAYEKELAKVNHGIKWQQYDNELEQLKLFKTKSPKFKEYLQKIQEAKVNDDELSAAAYIKKAHNKMNELLSKQHKAAIDPSALKFNRFEDVLNELFDDTNEWFKTLTEEERSAIINYTQGSGKFNRPLRGYKETWGNYIGKGNVPFDYEGAGKDEYKHITKALERSKTKKAMWTARGSDYEAFKGMFGESLFGMTEEQAKGLIGRTGLDEAFMSTSPTSPWGGVKFEIYMPAGTEAALVDPFSYFGGSRHSYKAVKWSGLDRNYIVGEQEILINRGYTYKIVDIAYSYGGWKVKMVVLDRSKRFFK